jgi:malonyl CoA-acyl carrier protein transacylase
MAALAAAGADTFLDVGPDQVLAHLVTRNVEGARAISLEEQRDAER